MTTTTTTFKKFLLLEEDANDVNKINEEMIKQIQNECSEWISATRNNLIYRGLKRKNNYIVKVDVRSNRKPRDSSKLFTDVFNKAIESKFKISNIRNTCSFVSGNYYQSQIYGFVNVVFYPNGYKLITNEEVLDAWSAWDEVPETAYELLDKILGIDKLEKLIPSKAKFYLDKSTSKNTLTLDDVIEICEKYGMTLDEEQKFLTELYTLINKNYKLFEGGNKKIKCRKSEGLVVNVPYAYYVPLETFEKRMQNPLILKIYNKG